MLQSERDAVKGDVSRAIQRTWMRVRARFIVQGKMGLLSLFGYPKMVLLSLLLSSFYRRRVLGMEWWFRAEIHRFFLLLFFLKVKRKVFTTNRNVPSNLSNRRKDTLRIVPSRAVREMELAAFARDECKWFRARVVITDKTKIEYDRSRCYWLHRPFTATNHTDIHICGYMYLTIYKLLTTDAQENIEEVAKRLLESLLSWKENIEKPIVSLSGRISLLIRFAFGWIIRLEKNGVTLFRYILRPYFI